MGLTITISRRRTAIILIAVALILAVLSFALEYLYWQLGAVPIWLYDIIQLFDVNRENTIPTWYSSALLLTCAVLIAALARAKRVNAGRYVFHWTLLALLFLFLSLDEGAAIHENFTVPFQESFDVTGYLYFAWLLVGVPFVLVVAVTFFKFWLHLPPRTRWNFLAAAVLYIGGAVVIESVSANQWYLNEGTSLKYAAIGTVEEFCEMSGVILFLYGLLTYLGEYVGGIHIGIDRRGDTVSPEIE